MFIILGIFAFGILIFIHELGHFLVAKAFRVRVEEFAMGMGPAIWKKQKGETVYSLRALPIGGFCAMEGEEEPADTPRSFSAQKWWKRVLILLAGAGMNFLLGLLLVIALYCGAGGFYTSEIASFDEGCPYEDTLQVGDRIISVSGERVYYLSNFKVYAETDENGNLDMTILRDGKRLVLTDYHFVPVDYVQEDGTVITEYGVNFKIDEPTVLNTLRYSWYSCMDFVRLVRQSLVMLTTGEAGLRDLSGVVGMVDTINETGQNAATRRQGVEDALYLIAFIAVNLAVMNLLPLPALDGGHIVTLMLTAAVEAVIGRKINPKVERYIHAAGLMILMALMVLLIFNDVVRLVTR